MADAHESRDSPATAIVAHRGASFDAPENTLAAIRLGLEQGADAVEIDVRLSRDGQVVACHDATAERTCGVDRPIADMTLAELKRLDAGAWKGPQWAGERVPTLDEALATIPPGKRMFVEVKSGPETAPAVFEAFDRAGREPRQTPVISFSADVCVALKAARAALPVYLLRSFKQDTVTRRWSPTVAEVIAEAKALGVDGVDLSALAPIRDEAAIAAVRGAGLELHAWTVDDAAIAQRLVDLGFDSITTNRPAWLAERLHP